MKRLAAPALALAVVALTGCAPSMPQDAAMVNCLTAYAELPGELATIAEQTGKPAEPSTPCDNWVESEGAEVFATFWTTPAEYLPFIIMSAKVEATRP